MITKFASFLPDPRRTTAFAGALLGMALCGSAEAAVNGIAPSAVVTNDTFSIEAVGYNTTTPSGDIYLFATNLNPTFGTTQTYANDALGGQTLTVFSSESTNNGTTTDNFLVSVPTNFIPAATKDNNGNIINAVEFSIGNYLGATNTLDFTTSITGITTTGSATYQVNGNSRSLGLTQNPVMSNNNMSYSDAEAGQSPNLNTSLSAYDITAFSVTLTYPAAVPEPSTTGAVLLGAAGLIGLTVVRRRRAQA